MMEGCVHVGRPKALHAPGAGAFKRWEEGTVVGMRGTVDGIRNPASIFYATIVPKVLVYEVMQDLHHPEYQPHNEALNLQEAFLLPRFLLLGFILEGFPQVRVCPKMWHPGAFESKFWASKKLLLLLETSEPRVDGGEQEKRERERESKKHR